jgi:signal-transduction protein with cAMP-binding, CBS, and nucleotidyltransferase domain
MPTVADSMKRGIKTIPHTATIKQVAAKMKSDKIGSLFVEKKKELVGIVTETDIVRKAAATGANLGKVTAEKIMSSPIATIESNRSNGDASDLMGDLGVRHLGVTEHGKIVGVISVRDVLVAQQRVSEPKITQD